MAYSIETHGRVTGELVFGFFGHIFWKLFSLVWEKSTPSQNLVSKAVWHNPRLQEKCIQSTVFTYTAVAAATATAGDWQQALNFCQQMREHLAQATSVSVGTAASACAASAQWQTALQVWDDFGEQRVAEDAMMFTSTISACERGREWAKGKDLFVWYHDHLHFTIPKLLYSDWIAVQNNLVWHLLLRPSHQNLLNQPT